MAAGAESFALAEPAPVDTTFYPVEEKMGEGLLQRKLMELLRPLVESYLKARKVYALTGADQFIYFRQGDIRKRVAPDTYVLPGVDPERIISSWKTWEERILPSFAVEVVSGDANKDYIDTPLLYAELGVDELIVFDPDYKKFKKETDRYRFQVFRKLEKRGLVRVEVTNEDRVKSKVLGCYLRAVGRGSELRLRPATGPTGDTLWPTQGELERAEKEREQAARVSAEAELAKLRAELAKLKEASRPKRK